MGRNVKLFRAKDLKEIIWLFPYNASMKQLFQINDPKEALEDEEGEDVMDEESDADGDEDVRNLVTIRMSKTKTQRTKKMKRLVKKIHETFSILILKHFLPK